MSTTQMYSYTLNENSVDKFNINQKLSIYISEIQDKYANEEYIKNLFENLKICKINSVYFRKNSNCTLCAVIYIDYWYNNIMVETMQKKIITPEVDAILVYDDPNYWLLHENKISLYNTNHELMQLEKIINYQNEKITTMEKAFNDISWFIKLHDANIEYLSNKINLVEKPNSDTVQDVVEDVVEDMVEDVVEDTVQEVNVSSKRKRLFNNNSCCGAVSDAWDPSYSSQTNNIWEQRLRPRLGNRTTYM